LKYLSVGLGNCAEKLRQSIESFLRRFIWNEDNMAEGMMNTTINTDVLDGATKAITMRMMIAPSADIVEADMNEITTDEDLLLWIHANATR